ncbi:radical SAM protein [Candidatus Micrarchaeota archaeon]|nr:radical SAM protein [Candidatus Micrarchaeota archaeon]
MADFQRFFSSYHSDSAKPIIIGGDGIYSLMGPGTRTGRHLSRETSALMDLFIELGLVRIEHMSGPIGEVAAQLQADERSNPARNIDSVTIELTGLCNLACKHCYRGGSRQGEYGLPVDVLKVALAPLLRAGIHLMDITGGEPTLRRADMLEIVDYAGQFLVLDGVSLEDRLRFKYGTPTPTVEDVLKCDWMVRWRNVLMAQLALPEDQIRIGMYKICDKNTAADVERILMDMAKDQLKHYKREVSAPDGAHILSNGCFQKPEELVKRLKAYGPGVVMQTSLDSYNEERTDANRGKTGVFRKVRELAGICHRIGFPLAIEAHCMGGIRTDAERSARAYFGKTATCVKELTSMLGLGNAVQMNFGDVQTLVPPTLIGGLSSSKPNGDGWCKGFTRPSVVHIRPTGNVGNCLYAYTLPEEFGNLHSQQMEGIINGIQNTRVYQMFDDGRIERYQHELDMSIFPQSFERPCGLVILTLAYGVIKERMVERGVDNPTQRANEEVALLYKFR